MENTQQLSIALKEMQSRVIGLFRPKYYPADQYIPVIEDNGGILTCVEVGTLLGLSTLTIGAESGRYVKFPLLVSKSMDKEKFPDTPQSLAIMMAAPTWFNVWYKENVFPGKQ